MPIYVAYSSNHSNITIGNWFATAIDVAWLGRKVDIISNSWAGASPYTPLTDAINRAVLFGRDGKGCVVVFASGNYNSSTVDYPAKLSNVIAVGAVDRCGIRSGRIDIIPNSCDPWGPTDYPGSSYGADLNVVAPGTNVYTTDRQGSLGYNTASGTAGNVNVTSGAKLTLDAEGTTTINGNFEVTLGSELEIK